jgi:hypothetical protein
VEYRLGREAEGQVSLISLNYLNNIYRNKSDIYEDSTENYINPMLDYWFDIRNGITFDYGLTLGDFERSPDLTGHVIMGRYTYRFNPRTSFPQIFLILFEIDFPGMTSFASGSSMGSPR